MPTKIIREPAHIEALGRILAEEDLPITVSWTKGANRSLQQNALSQRWYTEIATHFGDRSHGDVRADCKVTFGVPILRRENPDFAQQWFTTLGVLAHHQQRRAVQVFDVPVTRLMTTKQMTQYLDEVQREYSQQGVRLTDPEALKYEMEFNG